MPISRPTISSSAKTRSAIVEPTTITSLSSSSSQFRSLNQNHHHHQQPIMTHVTNLTRTRSLRLPTTREHFNSNSSLHNSSTFTRHGSFRLSSSSRSNQSALSSPSTPSPSTSFMQNSSNEVSSTTHIQLSSPFVNANHSSSSIPSSQLTTNNKGKFVDFRKSVGGGATMKDPSVKPRIPKKPVVDTVLMMNMNANATKGSNIGDNSTFPSVRVTSSEFNKGPTRDMILTPTSNHSNDGQVHLNFDRPLNFAECPASPISNCSIDSGIIGVSTSAQTYLTHLRKLTEEHERLQVDYARIRQQLIEVSSLVPQPHNQLISDVNSTSEDNRSDNFADDELSRSKRLIENYKGEVIRLQTELIKVQRKYWNNITNKSEPNGTAVDADKNRSSGLSNSLLQHKQEGVEEHNDISTSIEELKFKINELKADNKEAKESIEFLTCERSILAEALKDTEETLAKERLDRKKEKDAIEELGVRSKRLYEKVLAKNEKVKTLESKLNEKEMELEKTKKDVVSYNNAFGTIAASVQDFRNTILSTLTNLNQSNADQLQNSWITADHADGAFSRISTNLSILKQFVINQLSKDNSESTLNLKRDINELVPENLKLKSDIKGKEISLEKAQAELSIVKDDLCRYQEKVKKLSNEVDTWIEKYRCSEAVQTELRKQQEEGQQGKEASSELKSQSALRQEIAKLQEALACKDDMLEKFAAKYARNRQVWEENDRKASEEIKKLDEIIDHVITTIKSLPESISSTESIQQLLILLTEENE